MKIINTLNKIKQNKPPIWIMRQAGRYLPEFRKLKKESKGFINMVYTPKIASKITIQPIKRFKFDAAIIFSDILIIPDCLGQTLTYKEGKGPILKKLTLDEMLNVFKKINKEKLNLVYQAIKETKKRLNKETALIGFVGAPLTISFFMFDYERKKDYKRILFSFKKNKNKIKKIFSILENIIAQHAINQLNAGAKIIQIFDTWACVAKRKDLNDYSIKPIKNICKKIKNKKPNAKIIVFPRNVGTNYLNYLNKYLDCISVGNDIKKETIKKIQEKEIIIQGNLTPETLFKGGKNLKKEVTNIMEKFSKKPFIFNLAHGILPGTPIKNVEKLIKLVRN